jgi:hypothetical protein
LALEFTPGRGLVPHAALVRVAILGTKRVRRAAGRLDIEGRKLLSSADAGGQHQQDRGSKNLKQESLH